MASLIPDQEEVLAYLGFSSEIIISEMNKAKKFAEIEGLTNQKKSESDRGQWLTWFKNYFNRLEREYDEETRGDYFRRRIETMNLNNPRFILRNHIAQMAIEKAEKNDFSEARALLKLLENPFNDEPVERILEEEFKGTCKWLLK